MHLLAAKPGNIADSNEAVDLDQTPGDIIFASAADTEISALAKAYARLDANKPSLRLANLMHLSHNLSIDLWVDQVIQHSQLVVIRILGGTSYWPYGVERLSIICREKNIALAFLPGDDTPDIQLIKNSTLPEEIVRKLWQFLIHGGSENAYNFLRYSTNIIGIPITYEEPKLLPKAGFYCPELNYNQIDTANTIFDNWVNDQPVIPILFYRALVQADHVSPIKSLINELQKLNLNPLPIFISSLRDPSAAAFLKTAFETTDIEVIINSCAFAVSSPGKTRKAPLDDFDAPILQVAFSSQTIEMWKEETYGLTARDIAMHVALPEVDGRIFSRAIAFKTEDKRDDQTQTSLISLKPDEERIKFVSKLTKSWAHLRKTPRYKKKILMVLANYPNRNGRIGNGVGLDTPESTARIIRILGEEGYDVGTSCLTGKGLMDHLLNGVTNNKEVSEKHKYTEKVTLTDYQLFFSSLSEEIRSAVEKRWGGPINDPFFRKDKLGDHFSLPAKCFGKICVMIQPARGYNIDPTKTYHDPALVPPHGYFAAYFWARKNFSADAIVHVGKHGSLEWLPGKSLALSADCYPDAILGPTPNIYPFIVNDPGEGSQAKRRTQAVIIDHLTPPLTRADTHGELGELETLIDEYFEASHLDKRRLKPLSENILSLVQSIGLDLDCGINENDSTETALSKVDTYLCEIKEMQIRDGLHIFGKTPDESKTADFLVSLTRVPRGSEEKDCSITQALSNDLGLGFDPLDCDMGAIWDGPKPYELANENSWRTYGDTVERLEILASKLVAMEQPPKAKWSKTLPILKEINSRIRPALYESGPKEVEGLLTALDGRFVPPGPSGAPSRGRPEVLPTGRNFYSVDTRSLPTNAAWLLGWKSAQRVCEQYAQEHGEWPKNMAISAWGTACMRTGGDDIAQAMALIGARPTWDNHNGRVTGFEILPQNLLDRPRVDVTLRISGFFRDAFPGLISLFDSATRAISKLDENEFINPFAAQVKLETNLMQRKGVDKNTAALRASRRIFGSMPGSYGAGLQALIDESGWKRREDLADAYITWGGWVYGADCQGEPDYELFEERLSRVQAIIQNQDNREHDILDSDDYYQFEGGLSAAVQKSQKGKAPSIYHNDHSNPANPVIRSLSEEISRVVRGRAANPKWIRGVMKHGYKGAFEISATLDYLFAFAATTNAVENHHFEQLFDAYIVNQEVHDFILNANPSALKEIASRFREAVDRNLWKPQSNQYAALIDEVLNYKIEE